MQFHILHTWVDETCSKSCLFSWKVMLVCVRLRCLVPNGLFYYSSFMARWLVFVVYCLRRIYHSWFSPGFWLHDVNDQQQYGEYAFRLPQPINYWQLKMVWVQLLNSATWTIWPTVKWVYTLGAEYYQKVVVFTPFVRNTEIQKVWLKTFRSSPSDDNYTTFFIDLIKIIVPVDPSKFCASFCFSLNSMLCNSRYVKADMLY